MSHLDPDRPTPLGLPRGSVRAILALSTFFTALASLALERPLDHSLWLVTTVVLGYYYGSRNGTFTVAPERANPLWLPRGSVRWLMFLGYAGTAFYLIRHWRAAGQDPLQQEAFFPIVALGSFFLGRLFQGVSSRLASKHTEPLYLIYNNAKALVALTCSLVIVLVYLLQLTFTWDIHVTRATLGFVVFYFGSR